MANNDINIRSKQGVAGKEIKASAHYAYAVNGITLDGSKFATAELLLEGLCLVKDNTSGKYEKYADGAASPAILNGTANVAAADLAAINAGTSVKFVVNGVAYTIAYAALAALTAVGGEAAVVAAVKAAVNATGTILNDVASIVAVANKLKIATDDSGSDQTITFVGTWGVAGDQATVQGVLGLVTGATATGAGAFPATKSNPVILDESIQFVVKNDGSNPDLTAGQVLVHGAVYSSMLTGATPAFKAALKGIMCVE